MFFDDDISFCPNECENIECMRNSKNIKDKSIPHSYFVETPSDCPKALKKYKEKYSKQSDEDITKAALKLYASKDKIERIIEAFMQRIEQSDTQNYGDYCLWKDIDDIKSILKRKA